MGKKTMNFRCVILAVIWFLTAASIPCMAKNAYGTEEHIVPDSAGLDTGDADSVRQMIDELEDMREKCLAAISAEENEKEKQPGEESPGVLDELQEGEWITLDQAVIVRVPADNRSQSYAYVMLLQETDASVIWEDTIFSGVDKPQINEELWYLSEGQLIGYQYGIKDGSTGFAGILPRWKEERRGETLPLSGNGDITERGWAYSYSYESDLARYYQERAVSIVNPEVPGPLESVDIRLEEMADQMDLEDASSVISYIREIEWMNYILQRESHENAAETDLEERIVRLPIKAEGGGAEAMKTRDGRGGMILVMGGDSYSKYYYLDKELIGLQTGHSNGRFDFASYLPGWKDDETSMDVPLTGDEPKEEQHEQAISWESARQIYAEFVEEIWP